MLSEICLYLKNWFNDNQPQYFGKFTIENGQLNKEIQTDQYYRIVGSVFNDGVYKSGSEELKDETFNGAIWLMAVPVDVINLAADIEEWQNKYGSINSPNMSPFSGESFAGYSYSKSSAATSGSSGITWQSMFADKLRRYRKI